MRIARSRIKKSMCLQYANRKSIVEMYNGIQMENIMPPAREVFALMVLGVHASIIIGTAADNQLQLQTAA